MSFRNNKTCIFQDPASWQLDSVVLFMYSKFFKSIPFNRRFFADLRRKNKKGKSGHAGNCFKFFFFVCFFAKISCNDQKNTSKGLNSLFSPSF